MSSNNGKIVVGLIVVIAIALVLMNLPSEPSSEVFPAEDSTTVKEEPEWERLSSVVFYPGDFYFGGDDDYPHMLDFFYFSKIEEGWAAVPVDTNDFWFEFNGDQFTIYTDWDERIGTYKFTPGKISEEAITIDEYEKSYYYYVSPDRENLYLLLAEQQFPAQFGKNFWFKGTDTDDDGEIDVPYYLPAIAEFGYDFGDKGGTAIFWFDEDGDFEGEIKVFIDTASNYSIESGSRDSYKWQAEFLHGNKWFGFNHGSTMVQKQNSYGTAVWLEYGVTKVKMPAPFDD